MADFDPHDYHGNLEKAIAVLANRNTGAARWMTSAEISRTLREEHGIQIHWRSLGTVLHKQPDLVARRKRNHRWQYSALRAGTDKLESKEPPVVLVEPLKGVQNVVTLHDILASLRGAVSVCDPYADSATIEHLDSCSQSSGIRLLTHNITDSGRLRRHLAAFSKSGRALEVRRTPKASIHDRYVIDRNGMIIMGTSLNGFGKKESFLIKAGQDIRHSTLSAFNRHWSTATVWP